MAKVRELRRTSGAALVEQADGQARLIVPAETVQAGEVADEVLALGIPQGAPWEEIVSLNATPAALAAALRRRGIWDVADLRRNTDGARSALQEVYGLDLAALLRAAAAYEQRR